MRVKLNPSAFGTMDAGESKAESKVKLSFEATPSFPTSDASERQGTELADSAALPDPLQSIEPVNYLPPEHPWWKAVTESDVAEVHQLLAAGVHIDSVDAEKNAALRKAAQNGQEDILEELLQRNAEINRRRPLQPMCP